MDEGLVQPIAVSKRGRVHEDVVVAAVMASAGAWLSNPDLPVWDQWLAGRFTKTVRRGNETQLAAIHQSAAYVATYNGERAYGFVPMTYSQFPLPLTKMQVAGTNFPRSGKWRICSDGPHLFLNSGLNLTTGKCAAQLAHGVFIWLLERDESERQMWVKDGMPFAVWEVEPEKFAELVSSKPTVVTDAGLTEIDPGSDTVIVW